jgi:hypothetical protein
MDRAQGICFRGWGAYAMDVSCPASNPLPFPMSVSCPFKTAMTHDARMSGASVARFASACLVLTATIILSPNHRLLDGVGTFFSYLVFYRTLLSVRRRCHILSCIVTFCNISPCLRTLSTRTLIMASRGTSAETPPALTASGSRRPEALNSMEPRWGALINRRYPTFDGAVAAKRPNSRKGVRQHCRDNLGILCHRLQPTL